MDLVFTSPATCDVVARRTIRNVFKEMEGAVNLLGDRTKPLVMELARRGKIPRGAIDPIYNAIFKELIELETIMAVQYDRVERSRLSTKERVDLSFIQVISDGEDDLEFLACRSSATRQLLDFVISPMGFYVSHHVMSRYMQRVRRPAKTFFEDILRPMRMAMAMCGPVAGRANKEIALPFSSGMLMGYLQMYRRSSDDQWGTWQRYTRHDIEDLNSHAVVTPYANFQFTFHIKTFISVENMSPTKKAVYDQLLALESEFEQELALLGHFCFTMLPIDSVSDKEIEPLLAKAIEIAKSDEWNRNFPNSVAA